MRGTQAKRVRRMARQLERVAEAQGRPASGLYRTIKRYVTAGKVRVK